MVHPLLDTFTAMRRTSILSSVGQNAGFTLIELLTVMAIVGVLAAIAIPQYGLYRERGFDANAVHDLRNVVTAEEAYFAKQEAYISCPDAPACELLLPGYKNSAGVSLEVKAETSVFTATASHQRGSGKVWKYESDVGRFVFAAGP